MAKSNSSITQWLDAAGRIPVLPKEEVLRLASIIQNPETTEKNKKKAVDKLVLHNMKLIPAIVRRCMASKKSFRFGDDFTEDLLQCGTIGLYRAANKYDPTRGYCFSTYASSWIFQAVQREIYNNLSPIRIPENTIRDLYHSIDKNQNLYFADVSQAKRDRLLDAFNATQVRSVNCSPNHDVSSGLGIDYSNMTEASKAENSFFDHAFLDNEPSVSDSFEDIIKLAPLSQEETKVLEFYFVSNMSYRQIGKSMGIKESTAYNLAKSALAALNKRVSC